MSYDKKSGTIYIESDDPKDFDRDLLAHMAHVSSQIEKDLASGKLRRNSSSGQIKQHERPRKGMVMKWFAIVANVSMLGVFSYMVLKNGAPHGGDLVVFLLVLVAPVASLLALIRAPGDSWLGLYFKRKALEERQRIKKLEAD